MKARVRYPRSPALLPPVGLSATLPQSIRRFCRGITIITRTRTQSFRLGSCERYFFSTSMRLSPGLRSISLLYGSIPANEGFSSTTISKVVFSWVIHSL